MLIFIVFFFLTYSVTFLIADAEVFGCSTMGYLQKPLDEQDALERAEWIRTSGVLKIRQWFLHWPFFQKLFKCYFCLGLWGGVITHLFCYDFFGSSYFLFHPNTLWSWVKGIGAAALLGAVGSAIIDTKIIGRSE